MLWTIESNQQALYFVGDLATFLQTSWRHPAPSLCARQCRTCLKRNDDPKRLRKERKYIKVTVSSILRLVRSLLRRLMYLHMFSRSFPSVPSRTPLTTTSYTCLLFRRHVLNHKMPKDEWCFQTSLLPCSPCFVILNAVLT